MNLRIISNAGSVLSVLGACAVALPALAGGDKVAFLENLGVLFATVDRPDIKQYRELYAPQAAIEAAKKGQPMPDGTVITLI